MICYWIPGPCNPANAPSRWWQFQGVQDYDLEGLQNHRAMSSSPFAPINVHGESGVQSLTPPPPLPVVLYPAPPPLQPKFFAEARS